MVLLEVESLWTTQHTFFYLQMVCQIIDQCTRSGKELSQDRTIAYHLHAWIWLYIYLYIYIYIYMFQSKQNNMFGKVYSPDSDSFYIQKNIHKSINIITPTILGIGTHPFLKNFANKSSSHTLLNFRSWMKWRKSLPCRGFPVFGGGNLIDLYSLSIHPIVKAVQDRFCSLCVKYILAMTHLLIAVPVYISCGKHSGYLNTKLRNNMPIRHTRLFWVCNHTMSHWNVLIHDFIPVCRYDSLDLNV